MSRALPFMPFHVFMDNNGSVLNGGKLHFYEGGTSTEKTTWADSAMKAANANPVTLDSSGRATIFVRGLYKVVLKDSNGVVIDTWDYLYYPTISAAGASLIDDTSVPNMRKTLGLGTAAVLDVGTSGNNIVQLTAAGKYPAADGSLITEIGDGGGASVPYMYKRGLTLSRSANTTLAVSAGAARDQANAYSMTLSSQWTKTFASWVANTGNGGLDTGAIASSTWYYPYLIYDASGSLTDVLISASSGGPTTLPSGYGYYRRIGAIKTDSGPHILDFSQYGNLTLWKDPPASWTQSSNGYIGTTQQAITLDVPTGFPVEALITATAGTNNAASAIYFRTPEVNNEAPTSNTTPPFSMINVRAADGTRFSGGIMRVRTNASGQIYVRAEYANCAVDICTLGWYDLFED